MQGCVKAVCVADEEEYEPGADSCLAQGDCRQAAEVDSLCREKVGEVYWLSPLGVCSKERVVEFGQGQDDCK